MIIVTTNRIIEIDTTGPPAPYIIHEVTAVEIGLIPLYENLNSTFA